MKIFILALATLGVLAVQDKQPDNKPLESFALDELIERCSESGKSYLPFLERDTLSCGLYRLPAGGTDKQSPHDLDEIYYVAAGKAKLDVAGETIEVLEGQTVFVAAHAEHRFHSIEEDLELVVFFSKAKPKREGSAGKE